MPDNGNRPRPIPRTEEEEDAEPLTPEDLARRYGSMAFHLREELPKLGGRMGALERLVHGGFSALNERLDSLVENLRGRAEQSGSWSAKAAIEANELEQRRAASKHFWDIAKPLIIAAIIGVAGITGLGVHAWLSPPPVPAPVHERSAEQGHRGVGGDLMPIMP